MNVFFRVGIMLALVLGITVSGENHATAQTAACTTAGYAAAYSQCSSSSVGNQASTAVTSSQAVQASVAQTAGLVASRISSFTAPSSAPGQALAPQNHYKIFALGHGGTVLGSNAPNSMSASKAAEATTGDSFDEKLVTSGLAAGGTSPKVGIWADAAWSRLLYSKTGENFDGNILSGVMGIDYAVNKDVLIGLAGGYEDIDLDTEFNRGNIKGTGWSLSPYAVYKVTDNYSVDVSGGYTWLSYDMDRLDPGDSSKITGEQDAKRWFASGNINSDHWYDQIHVGGRVGILHAKEDKDDFTESNLTNNAGASTNVGQGYAGLRLGYLLSFEGGSMEPYIRALGRYAYDDGGSGDSTDGVVGLGTSMNYGALQLGAEGSAVVGRTDTQNYTARLNARVEF